MIPPNPIFDGHLDLAFLTEIGRDMHAELDDCRGRLHPASVTLASLSASPVRACLGTIFTEAVPDPADPKAETGPFAYPAGDALAARAAGLRQLKLYQAWHDAGVIRLIDPATRSGISSLGESPLAVGLLMEGADPIETPDHLDEFPGLLAVGLTWGTGSRYAGGNMNPHDNNPGLTRLGRELLDRLDERSVLHDLSHLSEKATHDVLSHTPKMVVASHSNARRVSSFGDATRDQRQLSDETIAEIGRRGGLVGLNLYAAFVDAACALPEHGGQGKQAGGRPSIAQAIDHVEHVAGVMGHRKGVALGSDLDGGFGADRLPRGIDSPTDLVKLLDELASRGWSDDEVCGFAWGNWARVLGLGEP